MEPRKLRVLRIEDDIVDPRDDVTTRAPLDNLEPISTWLGFCQAIAEHAIPAFDLLTIDLNFFKDPTTPKLPPMPGSWEVNPDYKDDSSLRRLGWSSRLVGAGKNTGLVIGATAVAANLFRDVPLGAAIYTASAEMVTRDVTSALLLGQILLAAGEDLPVNKAGIDLVRRVVEFANKGVQNAHNALPTAIRRFRRSLLARAGADGRRPSLWIDMEAIIPLQAAIASHDEKELAERLLHHGVQYYDRDGRKDSLSLHSLFVDCLAERNLDNEVIAFRSELGMNDVHGNSASARSIRDFISQLAQLGSTNLEAAVAFVRQDGGPSQTVNQALRHPTHRLLALLFAYCDQYAEKWTKYSSAWDPLTWQEDPARDKASLLTQLSTLLRILNRAQIDCIDRADLGLPLSSQGGESIMKLVHEAWEEEQSPALIRALGYKDAQSSDTTRTTAIQRMLDVLQESCCVRCECDKYIAVTRSVPDSLTLQLDRQDLARRLGFGGSSVATYLGDVIQKCLHGNAADFLLDLEIRPLPEHLHRICGEYMREHWSGVPEKCWPPCLAPRGLVDRD